MEDKELGAGKTCFVVTPIGDELAAYGTPERAAYDQALIMWAKVFEAACSHFGLTAVRSDKIAAPGELTGQIFTYLRDADVVIADLSGGNANVMYELGLRHTRRAPTIQLGEQGKLPFDVQSIKTIKFNRNEHGLIDVREKLIVALRAALQGESTGLHVTAVFDGEDKGSTLDVAGDAERSNEEDEKMLDDEPGLLEIMADGQAALISATEHLHRSGTLIRDIGVAVDAGNARMNEPKIVEKGFAGKILIARELAVSLDQPGADLEDTANEFFSDVRLMDAMVRYVVTRAREQEDGREESLDFLGHVMSMVTASEEAAVSIAGMRSSVTKLRTMSRDMRPVLDVIERGLGRFLEGIYVLQQWRGLIEGVQAEFASMSSSDAGDLNKN